MSPVRKLKPINYIRYVLYLIVLIGFSVSKAGSYEDFFRAAKTDSASTIQDLLVRGFDANTPDPNGQTALILAIREPAPKVVAQLLSWPKTDVEARNSVGESPLMLASLTGQLEWVKRLVAMGADVNKPGWTPLHYAATRSHLAVMEYLLENHAYIDASSPNESTPLMMAALYGTPSAVKLLLEAGADPSIKNALGLTAIDFALRDNRTESADLIAAFIRGQGGKAKW